MRFPTRLLSALSLGIALVAPAAARAQAVGGTCTSCSGPTSDTNCGVCVVMGTTCFSSLAAADRRLTVFETSDGHDARSLTFAHLVGGVGNLPGIPGPSGAVNQTYNGNLGWLYYGDGVTSPTYCAASATAPPPAFATDAGYHYPAAGHVLEDTLDGLDCFSGEIDRYYVGAAGHNDGDRVCDGEQTQFVPSRGAIFDLGGEANRVVVFPYTDHGPLPCESFEFTVWLSDNPNATDVADAAHPDPTKWNPSVLMRAFLQGWIPDNPPPPDEATALNPNLANDTMHDGMVQVFALPCGLTFRYASVMAGNLGNPTPACVYWSFDAELDAVAGLNEDDTAICPDADGDGFRACSCGGTDCDDTNANVHPGAITRCDSGQALNCVACVAVPTTCPGGTSCVQGFCAPPCVEGACANGFACVTNTSGGVCIPNACAGATCPADQVCGPAGCQDPCADARCPVGQVCRGGTCVDPCAGVMCPPNQTCQTDSTGVGRCVAGCTCLPCGTGFTCNATNGQCQAPNCGTTTCATGQTLDCTGAAAMCITPCAGVICPVGSVCDPTSGNCGRDACFGIACATGFQCSAGACVPLTRPDAGSGMDGSSGVDGGTTGDGSAHRDGALDGAGGDGSTNPGHTNGGCGCTTAGRREGGATGWAFAMGACVALAMSSRRRRATPGHAPRSPRR